MLMRTTFTLDKRACLGKAHGLKIESVESLAETVLVFEVGISTIDAASLEDANAHHMR